MKKEVASKTVAVLFGVFLSLLCAEIILRVFIFDMSFFKYIVISNSPKVIWELRPNVKVISRGLRPRLNPFYISTSSEELRDYEYSYNKTKPRIAVLGDSFTFGSGVNNDETYPKILEDYLNHSMDVINFGVPGYNTMQELEVLRAKVLKFSPDMVIIGYGGDDHEISHYKKYKYAYIICEKSALLSSLYYYFFIVKKKEEENIDQVYSSLKEFNEVLKKHRIKFAIFILFGDEYNNDVLNFCKNLRIPIYDLSNIYGSRDLLPDDHPNKNGHTLIATKIYELLIRDKHIILSKDSKARINF